MADGDLRKLFHRAFPSVHWQAVETGGTGSGVPDTNYCYLHADGRGREGWIEFKKTAGWKVTFQPFQVPWINRRTRAGGRVLVAVRQVRRDGDVLWLYGGDQAELLEERGLRGVDPLAKWAQPWPWAEVGRFL